MPVILVIVAVIAALYLFGALLANKESFIGKLFNIIFMLFRKIWVLIVFVILAMIIGSAIL